MSEPAEIVNRKMRVSNFIVKNKLANYLLNGCKYRLQLDVGRGVGIRDVGYVGLGLQL